MSHLITFMKITSSGHFFAGNRRLSRRCYFSVLDQIQNMTKDRVLFISTSRDDDSLLMKDVAAICERVEVYDTEVKLLITPIGSSGMDAYITMIERETDERTNLHDHFTFDVAGYGNPIPVNRLKRWLNYFGLFKNCEMMIDDIVLTWIVVTPTRIAIIEK